MGDPILPLWKALFLAILLGHPQLSMAYGNIGCLFKESLCVRGKEYCFDDYAFGKCLFNDKPTGFKHKLGVKELEILKDTVVDLNSLGFRWSDMYTQCRLQTLLYAIRRNVNIPDDYCDHKLGLDASKGRDSIDPQKLMDVSDIASVDFKPNKAEFAKEVYNPPSFPSEGKFDLSKFSEEEFTEEPRREAKEVYEKELKPVAEKLPLKKSMNRGKYAVPGPPMPNRHYYPSNYFPDFLDYDTDYRYPINLPPHPPPPPPPAYIGQLGGGYYKNYQPKPRIHSFDREYNTPDSFRQGMETKDWERENKMFKNVLTPVQGRGFTEGGIVYIPVRNGDLKPVDMRLDRSPFDILEIEDLLGFQRRERLDVKKPGPGFGVNSYAFKKINDNTGHHKAVEDDAASKNGQTNLKERNFDLPLNKKEETDKLLSSDEYERIDNSLAFVEFTRPFEGTQVLCAKIQLAKLLHLPLDTFVNHYVKRVDEKSITFGVGPLSGSDVAKHLSFDKQKDTLKAACNLEVFRTGAGDVSQIPIKLDLKNESDYEFFVATIIVCTVFAALIASAAAYYFVRRNSYTKQKLHSLHSSGSEPSKDYQDLCRARMATKTAQEGSAVPSVRVSKLSQDSDSPSSRSSTSSWSEEPALSNMDISTGHMVLSYMEDHLKNKDRLDTEWTALCAYEAEPCSVAIAQLPENVKKNRYVNALPYDHARVVLNELTNSSGSDYINASTITDHDPRNPAYIATQGPLMSTAADMWQMIWEQGCVVIVMLTRLSQNDLEMSYRYWPEEGSELYHIYEVHLVSEHIWCDDYLVRSFYLKNLKTGETRTVTQFHFLSWPEGGIPSSTKALLEFRRKVNKSFRGRSCPIVVHCSDGIGRTGTYCLLDMVLNRMAKGAKEIDIAATLEHIRDQRGGAVSTKQQFQFVLQAVAEEVQAILRVLPQQQNPQVPPPTLVSPLTPQPLPPPLTPQPAPISTTQTLPQPKADQAPITP